MKKYLPLGTVVLLKEGSKKIMIYGRRQIQADTGQVFDYVACFYPEGNISPEYTFLFNEDAIDRVIFLGFNDDEDKRFIEKLKGVQNDAKEK